jgi:uncharacterized protein YfbU (UPF0304 family)
MVHKKNGIIEDQYNMIGSLLSKNSNNYETIQPMTSGFAV